MQHNFHTMTYQRRNAAGWYGTNGKHWYGFAFKHKKRE